MGASVEVENRHPSAPATGIAPWGLYAMFVASGAAGLIYQLVWARWLGIAFGNTTASVTLVLAAFMGGLALGSWVAARALPRTRAPMLGYVAAETVTALCAFAFPSLSAAAEALFVRWVSNDTAAPVAFAVRAALALALLLPPTTLMGATLPLVTEWVRGSGVRVHGWSVGVLYAVNTLGAALGALVASFVLIELVGVQSTTMVAAALNVTASLYGMRLHRLCPVVEPAPGRGPGAVRITGFVGRATLWTLAVGGGCALASEVLWTRALVAIVGRSTYVFAVILFVYLVGIALGSALAAARVRALRAPFAWLVATQLGMGAWTLAALPLRDAFGAAMARYSVKSVGWAELLGQCATAGLLLLPLALLSGAAFPLATRLLDGEDDRASGERTAVAYAWNTAGAILGSLVAGYVVAPRTDLFHAIYMVALAYAASALALAAAGAARGVSSLPRRAALALAVGSLATLGFAASRLDGRHSFAELMRAKATPQLGGGKTPIDLVFYETGLQGTTAVLQPRGPHRANGSGALVVNGAGMTVRTTVTKIMAHLPLSLQADPKRMLVVCFGMGTTFRSALSHGVDVTAVELVKEVVDAFPKFFDDASALRARPNAHVAIADGRNWLELSRERFDVITVDPPPPVDGAGVNHLYSREWLEIARDHLTERGVMQHFIPLPSSHSGVADMETFGMLAKTFAEVFPHVATLPTHPVLGVYFLGSRSPIVVDPARVRAMYDNPAIRRDIDEWDVVPPEYFLAVAPFDTREVATSLDVTDDEPRLEFDFLRGLRTGARKEHYWILVTRPRRGSPSATLVG